MDMLQPERNFISAPPSDQSQDVAIGIGPPVRLPQWEHDLLDKCHLVASTYYVTRTLTSQSLTTCSDGSVTPEGGFFGYVLSNSTGQRLVKGNGSVPGSRHNSFRSEAYGVLATLRWLTQAYHQYPPHTRPTITHYLDNQSVIRRINNALKQQPPYPNSQLLPDQDVINEIVLTILQLPATVTLEWIRGHQDTLQPYHQLSLPAQLNCEADHEANRSSQSSGTPNPSVPPFSTTFCQFIIGDEVITSHIKRRIHEYYNAPRMLQYWKKRFDWSHDVCDNIDWSSYLRIIKKYKDKWTTLVKHVNAISPTGHIAHRNNPLLPHECPTCGAPHEDNHHIIQCPHPGRARWRQQTILKITRYRAHEIDPVLVDILRDGLTRYHLHLAPLLTNDYPEKYGSLIRNQNLIGWDQLYRARWAVEWTKFQDQYAAHPLTNEYVSGQTWILGLGRLILDQWFQLWKLRNADRHTRDNLLLRESRARLIHSELRHLYTFRFKVCPNDRRLFKDSADAHLQHQGSLDALEEWIHMYRPAIMASVEQASKLGISQTRTITDYPSFNPIPTGKQASLTAGSLAG